DDQAKPEGETGRGGHQMLYGKAAAESAMQRSLAALSKTADHNIKQFEERVVEGSPAQALLQVAGKNPKNLIVVGNRGLGASEGELLGSVPAEVVRNALCNVMIVQTTVHPNDLAAMTSVMEVAPEENSLS
ncbi:MAG TPA: universal stress protein, partial [Microlunatus sp.]